MKIFQYKMTVVLLALIFLITGYALAAQENSVLSFVRYQSVSGSYISASNNQIVQLSTLEGSHEVIYQTSRYSNHPKVSPDNQILAFMDGSNHVALLDMVTNELTIINRFSTQQNSNALSYPIGWANDGKDILYRLADVGSQSTISTFVLFNIETQLDTVLLTSVSNQTQTILADFEDIDQTLDLSFD